MIERYATTFVYKELALSLSLRAAGLDGPVREEGGTGIAAAQLTL